MTEPAKRKLSAKQILADIRSGMDAAALQREHSLSNNSFEYVVRQLSANGLLTQDEMRRLAPGSSPSQAPMKRPPAAGWRCPACNAFQPAEMQECPACGIVVARFVERQGETEHAAKIAPRFSRDAEPRGGKGWGSFILSVVVLALIGGALLIWSSHRAKETSKNAVLDVTTQPAEEVESEAVEPQENADDQGNTGPDYTELQVEEDQEKTPSLEPMIALPHAPHTPQVEPSSEVPAPAAETPKYVTGVLRQFRSSDFQKEVVEASKKYPVLFQFYSNT